MRNRIFEFDGEEGSYVGIYGDAEGGGTESEDTSTVVTSNDADTDTDLTPRETVVTSNDADTDTDLTPRETISYGYELQPSDPEAPGFRVYKDPNTGQQVVIDDKGRYWYNPGGDAPSTVVYTPEAPGKETAWGDMLRRMIFKPDGSVDFGKIATLGAGLGGLRAITGSNFFQPNTIGGPQGYTGTIPTKTLVRERVSYEADPTRRPGAGGRQYFTSTRYVAPADVAATRSEAQTQAAGLAALAKPKPVVKDTPKETPPPAAAPPAAPDAASKVIDLLPVPKASLAGGGLTSLARGRYLNGASDGMADKIPANIEGKQEARLSHGEFVVPADVVSHLGNGNSEAGAQRLYDMMDKIRKARTGTPKQGKQIDPNKFLPARG